MELWEKAIENHKKLMKARPDPSYWSSNIIDATVCLGKEDSEDWKVFYSYLIQSPLYFDSEKAKKCITLGDLDEIPAIPDYEEGTTFQCFKNGNEYTIIVQPKQQEEKEESDDEKDDEKIPE